MGKSGPEIVSCIQVRSCNNTQKPRVSDSRGAFLYAGLDLLVRDQVQNEGTKGESQTHLDARGSREGHVNG